MDGMVSLITNLATGNKAYVVFVGAGFSKDAGILSGWEVLLETLKPLYFLQSNSSSTETEPISSETIANWYLNNSEINTLGYSQILEKIHPGEIERREFIASLFADKQPGDAHRELAQLVSMGLVRFIFTTNFDDLTEKALEEYGIDYDVMFSDDILAKSKSWDKVHQCRIYKLHGDYKVGAIKNTDSELKYLDSKMGEDFQYIIDRHGIIFVGYSGRDVGVMNHILNRNPYPYPIYWQYKEFPENNDEYRYFYEMIDKYENTSKRPVFFLPNTSASNFLLSLREGVEKLNLMLTISSTKEKSFDSVVVNSDQKKLHHTSYSVIEEILGLYNEYKNKEDMDRLFTYKFEIFRGLIQKSEFLFHYLESLLKYDCDSEVEFLLSKIIKSITTDLNENYSYSEFIRFSFPYFIIVSSGSLILKHEKEPLLASFWRYDLKGYNQQVVPLMSILSYQGSGWDNIQNEIYKTKFIYPKYTIIRDHLRIRQLSQADIDFFDSYIFLTVLLVRTEIGWFNGSSIYLNSPFFAVYEKYFKNHVQTKAQYDTMAQRLRTDHGYLNTRISNSFLPFFHTLGWKLNGTH